MIFNLDNTLKDGFYLAFIIKTLYYKLSIIEDIEDIKNSKIAIYLESKTEKRTTHADSNG